jgi:hypothetical protein
MKFILGVFVGAALMLGSAYLHDKGVVRAGAALRELGHGVRHDRAVNSFFPSPLVGEGAERPPT